MAIQFPCPQCTQQIEVDDEFAGAQAVCPYCQATVSIPTTQSARPVETAAAPHPSPQTDSAGRNFGIASIIVAIIGVGLLAAATAVLGPVFAEIQENAPNYQELPTEEQERAFEAIFEKHQEEFIRGGLFVLAAIGLNLIALILGVIAVVKKSATLGVIGISLAIAPISCCCFGGFTGR